MSTDSTASTRRHRRGRASRGPIVTVEEHTVYGGLGGAVAEVVVDDAPGADAHAGRAGRVRPDRLGRSCCSSTSGSTPQGIRDAARDAACAARERHDAARTSSRSIRARPTPRSCCSTSAREVVAQARRPVPIEFPAARLGRAGRRRASGAAWKKRSTTACRRRAGAGSSIAAVAITNQRESVLRLGARPPGRPLGPVIVWQCRRTTDFCDDAARPRPAGARSRPPQVSRSIRCSRRARSGGCSTTLPGAMRARRAGELVRRNHRQLAALASDRRRRSRLRRHERFPHAAAATCRPASWDPDLLSVFSIPRRHPAGGQAVERRFSARSRRFTGLEGVPIASADWRFARRALRARRLSAGAGEGHLWHGLVADDGRARAGPLATRPLDDHRLGIDGRIAARAGRQHHGDRERRGMDRPTHGAGLGRRDAATGAVG